jgi:hypothetical protein
MAMRMISRMVISILTALILAVSFAGYSAAQSTGVKVKIDPNVNTGAVKKQSEPETQPESSGSYDSFKDDNNNGIDDRYEKAEKGRVIVQPVQEPEKPVVETKTDKEPKKEIQVAPPDSGR